MTEAAWLPILLAVGGYLIGSIPFGIVVTWVVGGVDPRTAGSRNIGFTNVLRVSGKKAGFLTLIGDLGKGWLIAWLGVLLVGPDVWRLLIAGSPILGHLYPIYLRFRGGKGVATAFGSLLGLAPPVGAMLIGVWLITAAVTRYSSAAAITAFALLPVAGVALRPDAAFIAFTVLVSVMILWRHKGNMQRLWQGTEPKMGQRRMGRLKLGA